MPGVFLAAPSLQPLPSGTDTDWVAITHAWQAWDGTFWDLSSGRSGVYLGAGVIGMGMPPTVRYTQKSPAVAGSLYRGTITDERPVSWPVKVFRDAGSQAWLDHNRAWWTTMHPEKTGRWVVTQPGGEYRTLDLRFVDDNQFAWASATDVDPELAGFANYQLSLIAEQPMWRGAPITITWTPTAAPQPFFAPAGSSSVLFISSSNATFGARIQNPGSVDAWPVWRARGPFTACSVGVGADQITMPFSMAAGQSVTIDTDPTVQTAIDDQGRDITDRLGSVDFAQVPPGNPSQLNVTMTGTGSVDVTLTPNYFTATAA